MWGDSRSYDPTIRPTHECRPRKRREWDKPAWPASAESRTGPVLELGDGMTLALTGCAQKLLPSRPRDMAPPDAETERRRAGPDSPRLPEPSEGGTAWCASSTKETSPSSFGRWSAGSVASTVSLVSRAAVPSRARPGWWRCECPSSH